MGTLYWKGTASTTAQVSAVTFGTYDTSTTRTITVGGVSVSAVDSGGTLTTALTALKNACTASTHPYFTAITWSSTATTIVGTAATAGVPFVFSGSVSGGTGTVSASGVMSTTTANSGPNDWSVASNWSTGAVPVNSDDVIIKDNSVNICWGLDQSSVTLTSLTIHKTYTGKIGLDAQTFTTNAAASTASSTSALEYRTTYLKISATTVRIGETVSAGSPAGSGRICLNTGSTQATIDIIDTAQTSSETNRPSVRLLASVNTTKVYVRKAPGGVGIAVDLPGETSTLSTISISDRTTTSRVFAGAGTTLTTWLQEGGNNYLNGAATVTTVTVNGGTLTTEGSFGITTLNANGGTVNSNSTGTVATLVVNGGTVDFTGSNAARTVTTITNTSGTGGTIKGDGAVMTFTNAIGKPLSNFTVTVS